MNGYSAWSVVLMLVAFPAAVAVDAQDPLMPVTKTPIVYTIDYNVCLLDPERRILEAPPTEVRLPVPGNWKRVSAMCYDPDAASQAIPCRMVEGAAVLTVPQTRVYKVIVVTPHDVHAKSNPARSTGGIP